jgi:hypothetical protein
VSERQGVGDRWLAGEAVAGVRFGHHDAVVVTRGRWEGRTGLVALLLGLGDDPLYLVQLPGEAAGARVRQSALAPAAP